MNPALAGARVFVFWPVVMSTWVTPLSYESFFTLNMADAITSATPMGSLHAARIPDNVTLLQNFFGQVGGSMGEISAFALLLGGLYLLARRVITPRIPLSFLLTVAVITFIFPRGNDNLQWMLWNLLSGGLMLGAILMATDLCHLPRYEKRTDHISDRLRPAYGIYPVFRRIYPESVSYSILIMNACVWLIDKCLIRNGSA